MGAGSLQPALESGEESYPGLGLLLLTIFLPRFCVPLLPHTGVCSFKTAVEKEAPSWVLFLWTLTSSSSSSALPFSGGGWQEEPPDRAAEGQTDSFQQMVQRGRSCVNLLSPPETRRLNSERAERQLQAGEGGRKKGKWGWK